MGSVARLFSPIVLIFAGALLSLAGLGLLQITNDLLLYLGLSLIIIAIASIILTKKSLGGVKSGRE
mgnify:CR=1 FL=1